MIRSNTKLAVMFAVLFGTALAGPAQAKVETNPTVNMQAISDRLRELGAVLGIPAVSLLADRVLEVVEEAPALLDDTAVTDRLVEARAQVDVAVDHVLDQQRSLQTRGARSAGFPRPGTSPVHPGGCLDPDGRFALLVAAHVAETLFEGTRFACEQDFPGAPNPSFLCIAPHIISAALRIAYEQVEICNIFEDTVFSTAIIEQMDHVHNDHTAHLASFDSDSVIVRNAITTNDSVHQQRTTSLNTAIDGYEANFERSFNLLDSQSADLHNRILAAGNRTRYRMFRTLIEQSLAGYESYPIASLILPSEFGGRLEQVREVATQALGAALAANINVRSARTQLTLGNTAFQRKQYKAAFAYYQRAYVQSAAKR